MCEKRVTSSLRTEQSGVTFLLSKKYVQSSCYEARSGSY